MKQLQPQYKIVECSGEKYYKVPSMYVLLKNNKKILIKYEEKIEALKEILKKQKDGFIDIDGEYVSISYIAGMFRIENDDGDSTVLVPINKIK